MFHYFTVVTNTKGDSLPGWQAEVVNATDESTVIDIYADASSTPIVTVSGVANRAVADDQGNIDLYVAEGTYAVKFYDSEGVYQRTQAYLPMYGMNAATAAQTVLDETEIVRDQTLFYRNEAAAFSAAASVGDLVTIPIALAENESSNYATSQVMFTAEQTEGVRTNSQGTEDAVDFVIAQTSQRLTNGGAGYENYWNSVFGIGWNITAAWAKRNPDMPAMSFRIESKFTQPGGTLFGSEYHLPEHLPINDTVDAQKTWRPISIFTPHLQSNAYSDQNGLSFQYATVNDLDPEGNLRRQTRFYSNSTSSIAHPVLSGASVQYLFDLNNSAFARQKNAAGTDYINADYLDDHDRWRRTGPSYESGPTPAASVNSEASGHGRFFRESFDSAPVAGGGWQFHLPNVAVAGNFTGLHLQGFSVSGTLYPSRSHNTHATGGVLSRQESSGGKNGMAFVDQSVGSTHYFVGRNPSGQFVIANDYFDLEGTNNPILTIGPWTGSTNNVTIAGTKTFTGTNTFSAASTFNAAVTTTAAVNMTLSDYADDTAAASGGIAVGQLYRTGSAVKVRVS